METGINSSRAFPVGVLVCHPAAERPSDVAQGGSPGDRCEKGTRPGGAGVTVSAGPSGADYFPGLPPCATSDGRSAAVSRVRSTLPANPGGDTLLHQRVDEHDPGVAPLAVGMFVRVTGTIPSRVGPVGPPTMRIGRNP
jgi:hypothetical protein